MTAGQPEALLFDMDGVLVDSFEIWIRVMALVAEELDCPPVTRAMVEKSWGQFLFDEMGHLLEGQDAEIQAAAQEHGGDAR